MENIRNNSVIFNGFDVDLRMDRMVQVYPSRVSLTNLLNDKLITKCVSGFERQTKDCNYFCLRLRVRS